MLLFDPPLKEIYTVKESQSHAIYEKIQAVERKHPPSKEKPGKDWPKEDVEEYAALQLEMKECWASCWK